MTKILWVFSVRSSGFKRSQNMCVHHSWHTRARLSTLPRLDHLRSRDSSVVVVVPLEIVLTFGEIQTDSKFKTRNISDFIGRPTQFRNELLQGSRVERMCTHAHSSQHFDSSQTEIETYPSTIWCGWMKCRILIWNRKYACQWEMKMRHFFVTWRRFNRRRNYLLRALVSWWPSATQDINSGEHWLRMSFADSAVSVARDLRYPQDSTSDDDGSGRFH